MKAFKLSYNNHKNTLQAVYGVHIRCIWGNCLLAKKLFANLTCRPAGLVFLPSLSTVAIIAHAAGGIKTAELGT